MLGNLQLCSKTLTKTSVNKGPQSAHSAVSCTCSYIYICISIYIYVYVYVYLYTYANTYIQTQHIYTCICAYSTHIYIPAGIQTYLCPCTHTHIFTNMYIHQCVQMCIYIYIYTYTHVYIRIHNYTHTQKQPGTAPLLEHVFERGNFRGAPPASVSRSC